jgi:tetratricopeptide (TPR) repeat protein
MNTDIIRQSFPDLNNKHIHELSVLLFRNILRSLRAMHPKDTESQIRELIDHAQLLYQRGLFAESLTLLAQAKEKARTSHRHFLTYEIIDFEKRIESRHVTQSHQERALELTNEAIGVRSLLEREGYWTELSLKLYDLYLKTGHVRNHEEREAVKKLFFRDREKISHPDRFQFHEQLYCFQSHVWYYYIIQDFTNAYRYAVKWIRLFDLFPGFRSVDRFQLLKGYHNCLAVLFFCRDRARFDRYHKRMEDFISEHQGDFDRNTGLLAFSYLHTARLNAIVMHARFSESKPYLITFEKELSAIEHKMDHHRLMIFRYKLATIYFTMGDHKKCIQLLNTIIHNRPSSLHEDVQCFSRILNLIAHYEAGNLNLIYIQVRSVYRFLTKLNESQIFQKEILRFLRKAVNLPINEIPELFSELYVTMKSLDQNIFENRALLYLDVLSWLESKIERKPVEQVIKAKRSMVTTP